MNNILDALLQISTPPLDKEEFDIWLEQKDALAFLVENSQQDEFILYAGLAHAFIHAILVPDSLVNPPDIEDLMAWNCNASSSWGISYTFSDPSSVVISPPLEHTGSKTLDKGEQLVFARHFEGLLGNKSYFEILQKFVHVSDLHFLSERKAYCRLNKHGDIEDVIRILEISAKMSNFSSTVITCARQVLDEYMSLSNTAAVQTFDFARYRPSQFRGWSQIHETAPRVIGDLFYRLVIEAGHASYVRGCQIVRSPLSKEAALRSSFDSGTEERQYASFIAHDWKNKSIREISGSVAKLLFREFWSL